MIHGSAFGLLCLLCYFYLSRKSKEASESNPAGGILVVVIINFLYVSVHWSVSQSVHKSSIKYVTLSMNYDWAPKAPDNNQCTDWYSVDYSYYVLLLVWKNYRFKQSKVYQREVSSGTNQLFVCFVPSASQSFYMSIMLYMNSYLIIMIVCQRRLNIDLNKIHEQSKDI